MTSDLATMPILVMHDDDGYDNQKSSIDGYCTGFDSDDYNNNNDHDVSDDYDADDVIVYDADDDNGDEDEDGKDCLNLVSQVAL